MRRARPANSLSGRFARPSLAFAAGYAAAEMLLGLLVGRFFDWGRAEALLFLAFRPWLMLAAALVAARLDWRARWRRYGAALLLASASETALLLGLGAAAPWEEAARGLAAGGLLLPFLDLLVQAGWRLSRRSGAIVAAILGGCLFLVPGGARPYEVLILNRPAGQAASRPDLLLMTALPIIWGEAGAFDPGSRPAAAYRALRQEFAVRPLDLLDAPSLAGGRLLLLAQPRALRPSELVALDAWVRRGGRALVLADPLLLWPSPLPLGDARRAPAIALLDPLLGHWGLRLDPPARRDVVTRDLRSGGAVRRLAMAAPGRFVATGRDCASAIDGLVARCRIGAGRALLVADADLLHDALWTAPGEEGDARHRRTADNPLILADWLESLSGARRARITGGVAWLSQDDGRARALLLAALPLLAALLAAAPIRLQRP